MKHNLRTTTGLVLLTAFATIAIGPMAGMASTAGKRNTAIGLTAGAVYAAIRHKTGAAVVLGAGAAYAWKRHADARRKTSYYRGYRLGAKVHKGQRVYFRKDGRLRYYTQR